jgi:hypothetical protein
MPIQPDTDRRLDETSRRQGASGLMLLALSAVLFAVGILLIVVGDGILDFAGVALCALGTPPLWAAIGLLGSRVVGKRASQQKPFA